MTPIQARYAKLKADYPRSLVLIEIGDFFEAFNDDAVTVSVVLNITLTQRVDSVPDMASDQLATPEPGRAPRNLNMCGFPYTVAPFYVRKLRDAGYSVVVEHVKRPNGSEAGVVEYPSTEAQRLISGDESIGRAPRPHIDRSASAGGGPDDEIRQEADVPRRARPWD